MGNKLCKKKSDVVDNPKSPTPFDRIINRLHLRPNSWKSDSHLNQKQVKCKTNPETKDNDPPKKILSKSSDWTDIALEVPDNDEAIHLRNPKLSLIFDNENSTPTPPPRKHKKGLREKIEAVAKNSLQAFQSKKPVEEPLCVKKTVNPTCPLDDHDCAIHNRNHKHERKTNESNDRKENEKNVEDLKQAKRRKNLSVVSLPNYNELKLSVANFDDVDKQPDQSGNNSLVSLPNEAKKLTTTASTGKLETCMTRCRSFGSLLPQHFLDKLRVRKIPVDTESDDSFGGLEDWDLRIIEHYNPTDTSLPRQTKPPRNKKDVLSAVEDLIVNDEDIEKPKVPARRSESLLRKMNREASESAVERRFREVNTERALSVTPPPSPQYQKNESSYKPPTVENGQVEHSNLMKILEEYSIKDKQKSLNDNTVIIPTQIELQKKIDSVEDFLNNEKLYVNKDVQHTKLGNMEMVKT